MRHTNAVFATAIAFALAAPMVVTDTASAQDLRPATVGSAMPDFTLPAYQGGEVALSDFRGQNVLLIFPRGRSRADAWCHICNYQHSELVDYEIANDLRQQHNLEIIFVLPYGRDLIDEWIAVYPQQLQDLEDWKNPDQASLDDAGRRRMQFARQAFPKVFAVAPDRVPGPFPILMDGDRAVSSGLDLFRTEWGGSEADQNLPTIYIINSEGTLVFKYVSQNTMDRPPLEYLVDMLQHFAEAGR